MRAGMILLAVLVLSLFAQAASSETAEEYYDMGNVKHTSGDYKGAIADYDKAIELDPDLAVAYNNRAGSKANIGKYKGAVEDYDKAIEIEPDYVGAYFGRGLAKILMSQEKDGCLDLSKADELEHPQAPVTIKRFCKKDK